MIKSTRKGFTLIELLVVIAIIGILSSVVIASMNSARQKSRDARRISDVGQIKTALELFYDSNQAYPTTTAALATSYIPRVPTDPQNASAYYYVRATSTTSYCLGANLEDSGNVALDNDADTVTCNAFYGGAADCDTSGGTEQCFDVTP